MLISELYNFSQKMANEFLKSQKIFFHDRVLQYTILPLIPRWVYPNYFTIARFVLTPVVAYLMFTQNYAIGLWAFLITAFTDALDGSLARTRDQITAWGKLYDPIADKILIASMVYIIVLRYLDIWSAFFIILIELIIIVVAWYRVKRKIKVDTIQSNIWGKIKMILQVLGVTILLFSIVFDWAALLPLASGVLYLAIAFAIVSLLSYGI